MIEITRNLTDWKTLALKVKARGSPLVYALEIFFFFENSKKVARSLREVKSEELENQFSKFLDRLYTEFKDKTLVDVKEADSKQIIKTFMRTPALYREIEMVLQATVIGAIKISVESVAESIISKYALHNSKIRKLNDSTANDEMFIAVNGPELGEADALLAKALDRKLAGKSGWYFSTKQTLFRTSGVVVNNIFKRKK